MALFQSTSCGITADQVVKRVEGFVAVYRTSILGLLERYNIERVDRDLAKNSHRTL